MTNSDITNSRFVVLGFLWGFSFYYIIKIPGYSKVPVITYILSGIDLFSSRHYTTLHYYKLTKNPGCSDILCPAVCVITGIRIKRSLSVRGHSLIQITKDRCSMILHNNREIINILVIWSRIMFIVLERPIIFSFSTSPYRCTVINLI